MEEDGGILVSEQKKDGDSVVSEQKKDCDSVVPEQTVSKIVGEEMEPEDEDEDEDFDFDPFLQNMDEKEASSSLSSEDEEGLDVEGKDQLEDVLYDENEATWLELGSDVEEDEFVGNYEDDDEDTDEDENTEDNIEEVIGNQDENTEDNNEEVTGDQHCEDQQGCSTVLDRAETENNEWGAGTNTLNSFNASGKDKENLIDKAEVELGQTMDALPDLKNLREVVIVRQRGERNDEDIEDAICKRTRARYSLADMSLDELETFLQESDEEDYFQNVDDEEEYRKFLAAVAGSLEGNNGHDQVFQNKEDENDDDEDNDADFEIEIEEALESDDEIIGRDIRKRKHWEKFCRPNTRESRRRRTSIQSKDRLLGLAKTPLRPLLPLTENLQTQSRSLEGKSVMSAQAAYDGVHIENRNLTTGFTAHQIGQLHCLIHEHVQLLVQVYSLCVLDPSRQQIAFEARKMLNELVDKRGEVLSLKKNPYPDFCFHPPYIHPSVSEIVQLHAMPMLSDLSNNTTASTAAGDNLRNDIKSGWVPAVSGPIQSVLDVAPVGLVRDFLNDIDLAVQESRQQHVKLGEYHSQPEREPLFPLPVAPEYMQQHLKIGECLSQCEQEPSLPLRGTDLCSQAQKKTARGTVSSGINIVSSTHPYQKKTMAATMVENTKRQSVALVSKNIVKVVQRFYPLFNAALFPHKPPPASTANRVLFTDAEDELLAMGLMTYNNNWKAIKERFLPSKSMHQIFVRQKNRASSRAPENSIKAVRRMKTSPLTTEEKTCIHEGLKVLKYDWMKVWEYCVPYRDPNLLRRQWRVAHGTQKSYKTKDDATKEKRRLYEARRRKSKALQKEGCNAVGIEGEQGQQFENDDGEENSGDENVEETEEAYVHEAFLADWKPYSSRFMAAIPQAPPVSGMNSGSFSMANIGCNREGGYSERMGSIQVNSFNLSTSEIQPLHQATGCQISQIPYTSQLPSAVTTSLQSTHQVSFDYARRPIRTQVNLRPYRSRNKQRVQTVKLAPGLPTLNLPPTVRVIPQSMLMGQHCGGSQRLHFAQNKKPNPQSCTAVADPKCHLQTSRDITNNRLVKPDSSTVATTTFVSSSIVGLERSLSSEANVHFNRYNYEKEVNSAQQNSLPTLIQGSTASHESEETPQIDTQANHETNEIDIHIHPLLLQNSFEDSIRYQCNKYDPRAPVPFSTLQGNAHNSDFHSVFMPFQRNGILKHQVAYPPVSLKKGTISSSNAADFHPLLQRNTEFAEASSTVNTNLSLQQPCNSEENGVPSMHVSPSVCVSRPLDCQTGIQEQSQLQQRELPIPYPVSDASKMHSVKHSDTRDDKTAIIEEGSGSKELEFTKGGYSRALQRKQTVRSRKQTIGQCVSNQSNSNLKRRRKDGTNSHIQGSHAILNKSASYFHGVENVMENDPAIYLGMNHTRSSEDNITSGQFNKEHQEASRACLKDDSLPEIVMEREELSDSEDDIGESVQFEYEEMDDSDGDYSAFEQQSNMLDKEEHCIEFEKEEMISEGDETEEDCRPGNRLSHRTTGVSEDTLSASAAGTVSKRQNMVRNKSKKLQCWDSATDSLGIKSKKRKQSCKQAIYKRHSEAVQIGCRKKRRIKESKENSGIQTRNFLSINSQEFDLNAVEIPREGLSVQNPVKRLQKGKNIKSTGQTTVSIDAGGGGCSSALENRVVPKMPANGSGLPSEISARGSDSCVFDKENSTRQCTRDTDKTAIEAAQVLTGIHQSTADKKNGNQTS